MYKSGHKIPLIKNLDHKVFSFIPEEVKTTLLLNVCQGQQQKSYDATLFESLKESSIFYQRPVDDILLLGM